MTGTGYLFFTVVTEQPTSVFIWTVRLDQSQINTGSKKILFGLSYQLKGFKIRGHDWCISSTWTPQLNRNCSGIWFCYTLGNVFFKVSADVHDLNILRQMKIRVRPQPAIRCHMKVKSKHPKAVIQVFQLRLRFAEHNSRPLQTDFPILRD